MKILKRSQIAMLSITLMIAVAGYINYKYNPEREENLGQTVYVNGKDSFTYDNVNIYSSNNIDNIDDTNYNENDDIIADTTEDDSIAVFKYDRDNMYSELSENYRSIINNSNTSVETINEYQKKLDELISQKNLISMVENVIKAKGIEDICIIPTNNDNLSIVIKAKEELQKEQIAQIQKIITDEFGISADKISISTKIS